MLFCFLSSKFACLWFYLYFCKMKNTVYNLFNFPNCMRYHRFLIFCTALFVCVSISASDLTAKDSLRASRKERVSSHLKAHLKPYGFVRNYFTYDTRECVAGTGDLFSYLPKDNDWNQTVSEAAVSGIEHEDLNARQSFRFLSLTTRGGLDIVGYRVGNTQFGGRIEADFYYGLTGVTGVAQLRLRHAYMTLAWDSLKMGDKERFARVDLLIGQTWHPMAADLIDVIALNGAAPFGPFSRTPQVRMDARLADWFSLTAAAVWQMQYTSAGPNGASAEYIKYSRTPEAFVGLNFMAKQDFLLRLGLDVLHIQPRTVATRRVADGSDIKVKVNERITTLTPFIYLQYRVGDFKLQAKSVFAEAGEHVNLNGGYGVSRINADGTWEYTPTRNLTSLICLSYGKDIKGILFAGYVRNFGTKEPLADTNLLWFSKNSFPNLNRAFRLSPALLWTLGRFQLGAEYELTSAQYGEGMSAKNGLAAENLHWVMNHRVQLMTKFNF